jgi:hypothetical protein
VFRNGIAIEYGEAAADTILRGGNGFGVGRAEADGLDPRLAAERVVDGVLADSFPASDPPSWTLGITHPQPDRQITTPEAGRAGAVKTDAIDIARPAANGRTFLKDMVSLAGAASVALLVPLVILVIGIPIALALRGVVDVANWLIGLAFG